MRMAPVCGASAATAAAYALASSPPASRAVSLLLLPFSWLTRQYVAHWLHRSREPGRCGGPCRAGVECSAGRDQERQEEGDLSSISNANARERALAHVHEWRWVVQGLTRRAHAPQCHCTGQDRDRGLGELRQAIACTGGAAAPPPPATFPLLRATRHTGRPIWRSAALDHRRVSHLTQHPLPQR